MRDLPCHSAWSYRPLSHVGVQVEDPLFSSRNGLSLGSLLAALCAVCLNKNPSFLPTYFPVLLLSQVYLPFLIDVERERGSYSPAQAGYEFLSLDWEIFLVTS